MTLSTELLAGWPPLAWLAHLAPGSNDMRVRHGASVEVGPDWVAEAVWDGPFGEGGFDQTDLVFGSGVRRRGSVWRFVASGTTLDRLHSHRSADGSLYVSNSLACLTQAIGASVDPHSRSYFSFFESIIHGFDRYEKTLATSAGDVKLTYFRNLELDGDTLREVDKPRINRGFSGFESYHTFLLDSMKSIGTNLADPRRKTPLTPIASISTGYDSPTVATVAREAGLQETLSIIDSRSGVNDDGSEIAKRLGLRPLSIPRNDWRAAAGSPLDVSRFIAADAKGEDVYFSPAAGVLSGRVLFTGYRGSRVWKPTATGPGGMSRSDQSGLSHTEARLHGGYLHVPLPYVGSLDDNKIRAIGASAELAPWSLGGNYDQPVCRRIVEEAGVPRELFGQEKKAASVLLFDRSSFLPPDAEESFSAWCREHRIAQRGVGERLTMAGRSLVRVQGGRLLEASQRTLQKLPTSLRPSLLGRIAHSPRLAEIAKFEPRFDYVFPWALAETQRAYR